MRVYNVRIVYHVSSQRGEEEPSLPPSPHTSQLVILASVLSVETGPEQGTRANSLGLVYRGYCRYLYLSIKTQLDSP